MCVHVRWDWTIPWRASDQGLTFIFMIWYSQPRERNGLFITQSSSSVIKFVIGPFLKGAGLIDMNTFKESKSLFLPCLFFFFFPPHLPPEVCQMKLAIHTFWHGSLWRVSRVWIADHFSGSDEHLSLQLEYIQACSHFVKKKEKKKGGIRLGDGTQ